MCPWSMTHAYIHHNPISYNYKPLQLRLLALRCQIRHQQIPEVIRRLADEVAHPVGADALADDVEVKAGNIRQYLSYTLRKGGK